MITAFKLNNEFIEKYESIEPDWGYGELGKFTYYRTYSRRKEDGTQEKWIDTVRRVVEGTYELQRRHCLQNRLSWDLDKAERSAEEMFDRMFNMKFLPPGRGLWMMGTDYVMSRNNGAPLQNCGMISTESLHEANSRPFTWLMDMSMLGVGVGFDTKGAGAPVYEPTINPNAEPYVISDSREGWVDSVRQLIDSYLLGTERPFFSYDAIRPAGEPIKGFGGTASGPGPLKKLHNRISLVLDRAARSCCISSTDIVDIQNMIGACVVAGNVRRSAEIALGNVNDDKFLDLKNYEVNPQRVEWSWASNNSLIIEDSDEPDYTAIAKRIADNGEPGLVYLDNARKQGRIGDLNAPNDSKVAGFNPCLTADSWVMTDRGPRQIGDIVDNKYDLLLNGKLYDASAFWSTGVKDVFLVQLENGMSVRATDNHQILTSEGWIEVGDLNNEHKVVVSDNENFSWYGEGTVDEGYLLGLLVGDGTFATHKNGSDIAVLSVWDDDSIVENVERIAFNMPHRSDFNGFSVDVGSSDVKRKDLRLASITALAAEYDITRENKTVTKKLEESSTSMYIGFLQGLFDADGSVQGTREKGFSVRLHQSDLEILKASQRMLARLGIFSTIYQNRRPSGYRELPDGNGGKATYFCKATHDLVISKDQIVRFADRVGFMSITKAEKLDEVISSFDRGPYTQKFESRVLSIIPDGTEEVFDATVYEPHAFDANGIVVHNCAEQQLEDGELCNLVEVFPTRCDNIVDFLRTIKFAYLYAKTVTLVPTHDHKTNKVMERNRRIGTSVSGVVQFLHTKGDKAVLEQWLEAGYGYINNLDNKYSTWLDVPTSIRKTTVKPSGTISILAGVTPGVHYPVADTHIRRIRVQDINPLVAIAKDAGYHVEQDQFSDNTVVIEFPVQGHGIPDERSVTVFDKADIATFMAKHWADNAVSCTITFKPEESSMIETVIRQNQDKWKTVSFLKIDPSIYPQMPYESVTEDEWRTMAYNILPMDFSSFTGDGEMEKFCTTDVCDIKLFAS